MNTGTGSWYESGYPSFALQDADSGPARLFIPAGERKVITFVDAEPFGIHTHLMKVGNDWVEVTCDGRACCQHLGRKTSYNGFLSVVENAEWTSRKSIGVVNFSVKLIKMRIETMRLLQKLAPESRLAGMTFTVSRSDRNASICGDEFIPMETVDMADLFGKANYKLRLLREMFTDASKSAEALEDLKTIFKVIVGADGTLERKLVPFNYVEILKPKTEKEIRELAEASKPAL